MGRSRLDSKSKSLLFAAGWVGSVTISSCPGMAIAMPGRKLVSETNGAESVPIGLSHNA